ncbi:uncharacterized protein LOC130700093 [Daphnia carinata]|uniref:uncharacterized protein LOC130700093 n=1 Tax=Daphnia carinata TaxID=120202 RepID=UPI00257A93B6|nr:uncharacterized protein LOC130700093 [Daphnia carinata]
MFKTVTISFLLMALLANGLPRPTISKESLRNKITPSMTLVFQSLHDAATIKASEKDGDEPHFTMPELNVGTEFTEFRDKPEDDFSVARGIFGDTESGRMPRIVIMPIIAI